MPFITKRHFFCLVAPDQHQNNQCFDLFRKKLPCLNQYFIPKTIKLHIKKVNLWEVCNYETPFSKRSYISVATNIIF